VPTVLLRTSLSPCPAPPSQLHHPRAGSGYVSTYDSSTGTLTTSTCTYGTYSVRVVQPNGDGISAQDSLGGSGAGVGVAGGCRGTWLFPCHSGQSALGFGRAAVLLDGVESYIAPDSVACVRGMAVAVWAQGPRALLSVVWLLRPLASPPS